MKLFKLVATIMPVFASLWGAPAKAQSIEGLIDWDKAVKANAPACEVSLARGRLVLRPVKLPKEPVSADHQLICPDAVNAAWSALAKNTRYSPAQSSRIAETAWILACNYIRAGKRLGDADRALQMVMSHGKAARNHDLQARASAWRDILNAVRSAPDAERKGIRSCISFNQEPRKSEAASIAPPAPQPVRRPASQHSPPIAQKSRLSQMAQPSAKPKRAITTPPTSSEIKQTPGYRIPRNVWNAMQGKSWHRNLPCPAYEELAYLTIRFWNFQDEPDQGHMIVARDVADDVLKAFALIYKEKFRIQSIRLVHEFGGNDDRSMEKNNTSAFNCRMTTSGRRLSEHSHGRAIDINPIQNPYVTRRKTVPPAGRAFNTPRERRRQQPGLIQPNGPVVAAFRTIRWRWGGSWNSVKDYQHFSQSGR